MKEIKFTVTHSVKINRENYPSHWTDGKIIDHEKDYILETLMSASPDDVDVDYVIE